MQGVTITAIVTVRVLEFNFEIGWRGGERQTFYNMLGFRQQGLNVELICKKNSVLETQAVKEGFTVHAYRSILGIIPFLLTSARHYDFLHAQNSQILTFCVFTKPFHRRKVIFTRRVNFAQRGLLTKLKYYFTDKIIAISAPVKERMQILTGRNDIDIISDIVVKPEPDVSRADEFFGQYNIGTKKIIATVASFTKEKDPVTTFEAIRILRTRRDDFIFFHFGSGELQPAIEEKIRANGLSETYIVAGFHPNIESLFSRFHVFILTSVEEGLGSSVLDAFVNKVPVVASNAGGLQDLLANGRGILCKKGASQEFAQGLEILLSDAAKVKSCTESAYAYANEKHNMQIVSTQYIHWMNQQI